MNLLSTTNYVSSFCNSRGEIRTLGVGCLIALLSGAAVAVGILSDNIASLVGVAISTSLMPPAVNAGLLWSLAIVYYVKGNETTRYASLSYTEYYSTDRFIELTTLGAVSLCLTFVNIICIYFAGILVFKIKEVAPISNKDHARRQFWKHDIKVTRNYNKTLQKEEAKKMKAKFLKELGMAKRSDDGQSDHLHHSTEINREEVEKSEKKTQYTWSPCTMVSKRPTIQELQDLYNNLVRESPKNSPKLIPKTVRKLSQIFANSPDVASSRDSVIIPISEPSTSNHQPTTCGRKFTVTPCELEVPNFY
ncbi:PREDICTED: uncharacterized protein LOC108559324 [Nicrophorus vespilloides]|uniref:Uncharacterized protein LOC108559324 n=1 Tax=Nicrophorus vespilloides TaxID=110193 RepID=A0ABM1MBV8_NICVS|nr:PREDICTED: uncharacterized protein LOC108559324 [Nicrophorus vespilloides]